MFSVLFRVHGEDVGGLADVVYSPEWFKARRKRSPDELIVTVSVAGVLLRGVVDTRVGGVIRRIFFLTEIHFTIVSFSIFLPKSDVIFLQSAAIFFTVVHSVSLEVDFILIQQPLGKTEKDTNFVMLKVYFFL